MSWFVVAISAALSVIAIIVAVTVKPPQAEPPELRQAEVPTAEEGREIPVVFGTVLVTSANVVWYGDPATSPVKTKSGK